MLGNATFSGYVSGWIDDNTTVITLLAVTSGANFANQLVNTLTSGASDLYIQGTYRV
jgi:hypothetical protein